MDNKKNGFCMRNKQPPFEDTFSDPLCKLNLKETSEFVKAFPISSTESRGKQRRFVEAPSTPGRPVFSFSVGNLARKNFPSKWDDAQKWLISSSCNESPSQVNKARVSEEKANWAVSGFHDSVSLSTDVLLKDKFTDNVDPVYPDFEPAKEGFMFKNTAYEAMRDVATEMVQEVRHRDVGTEMTPIGSKTTSRCHTPVKVPSPARHNTPADRSGPLAVYSKNSIDVSELQECHFAKLELGTQFDSVASNWSSRAEEEEEVSKSLRHFDKEEGCQKVIVDSRVSAWEEEERTKSCIRYQREEAKIQAWVNLQSAKAEAQSRKLEVKIQKMRSNLEEKLMKRMAIVHRKAEEWRTEAQQQHSQQIQKATEQAHKLKKQNYSHHHSCGCFPCNNHHL